MRLMLIRHGQSKGNVDGVIYGKTDYDLTQEGRLQSEAVRQKLKYEKVDAVFSSPLKRAQNLAQLVASDHALQLYTDERISEMNYGVFEGLTLQEVEASYGVIYKRYLDEFETYIIPGGEGYSQFRERIFSFLEDLIAQEGHFIVVTHSGVIRESLIYLLQLKPEQVWHFKIEPACTIQISYENGYGTVEEIRR